MVEQHTPRSLIVTFYGAYGRSFEGAVPVSALVRLLGAAGVDAPSVRSSVSRLKRRGFLVPAKAADGSAGYEPSDEARLLLEDGDRRIYGAVPVSPEWLVAVFSVPEQERNKRHLLRSRLARLGFGAVAPGVWIAPAQLAEETEHTLERLHLTAYVELFRGAHLGFAPTAEAVARWWDLAALAKQHEEFLDLHEPALRALQSGPGPTPEAAYRTYLTALDTWRRLPYADPGLPRELLPADWPGDRAAAVFAELHTRLRDTGARFVQP
ncbi:PaaX family transcriptional regulator C-terminal domain-containing protein [Streptomyces sp. NPDC089915]|uniref:PaaX family transcriptional regulator n=1 Tax=Streptomyces sp. NPDC089915 TaxID=3155186 RepID=UPI003436037E